MFLKFVMWYMHRLHIKYKLRAFYIKGTGNKYPRCLLYTEDKNMYKRMDEF